MTTSLILAVIAMISQELGHATTATIFYKLAALYFTYRLGSNLMASENKVMNEKTKGLAITITFAITVISIILILIYL